MKSPCHGATCVPRDPRAASGGASGERGGFPVASVTYKSCSKVIQPRKGVRQSRGTQARWRFVCHRLSQVVALLNTAIPRSISGLMCNQMILKENKSMERVLLLSFQAWEARPDENKTLEARGSRRTAGAVIAPSVRYGHGRAIRLGAGAAGDPLRGLSPGRGR